MECFPTPRIIPSATGIGAKELARYVGKLRSRERIVDELYTALSQAEKQENPLMIFVVAEWGEGKTSLYDIYLTQWAKENNAVLFLISSGTLFNYLEKIVKGEIFKRGENPAYKFLTAILATLRESYNLIDAPDIYVYEEPRSYVKDFLNYLNQVYPNRKYLLFIDEFEDIIHYYRMPFIRPNSSEAHIAERVVRTSLQGIVHIANNEVAEIGIVHEVKGKFLGRVYFIFAITPGAWSTIKKDPALAAIVGRLREGRITEIRFSPLNKLERIQFIKGLVSYMYSDGKGGIIRQVFRPASILNSITVSTLGNMAFIQTALTKIIQLNRSKSVNVCPHDQMLVLNPQNMMGYLRETNITMYEQAIPLVYEDLYMKIEDYWHHFMRVSNIDQVKGEKVFTTIMLSAIIDPDTTPQYLGLTRDEFERIVREIRLFFKPESYASRELGIQRDIIYEAYKANINPMKLYDIVTMEYMTLARKLPITGSEEEKKRYLHKLIDSFIFIDDNGEAIAIYMDDFKALSEYISEASEIPLKSVEAEIIASALIEIFKKRGIEPIYNKKLYVLSPKVLKIIYISPELLYLDYIVDRIRRFSVWRKSISLSTGNLDQLIASLLFILNVKESMEPRIDTMERIPVDRGKAYYICFNVYDQTTGEFLYKFNALIYSIPSRLIVEELNRLYNLIERLDRQNKHPHIAFVIYFFDEDQVNELIRSFEKSTFTKIVKIRIPSFLIGVQLISLGMLISDITGESNLASIYSKLMKMYMIEGEVDDITYRLRNEIDRGRLDELIARISMELPIRKLVSEALKKEPTTVVEDISLETTVNGINYKVRSPTELIDAFRYMLIYDDEEGSIEDIFNYAIQNYMIYHEFSGKRGILSPDLESATGLMPYVHVLNRNGFIKVSDTDIGGQAIIKIDVLNPVEKTIVDIMRKLKQLDQDPLYYTKYLVYSTKHPYTMEAYHKLLRYRGLVFEITRGKHNILLLTDANLINEYVRKLRADVENYVKENRNIIDHGIFIMFSKRKWRAFTVKQLLDFIYSLTDRINNVYLVQGKIHLSRRLLRSLLDLFNYYRNEWDERLRRATSLIISSRNVLTNVRREIQNLADILEGVINKYMAAGEGKVSIKLEIINDINESIGEITSEIRRQYSEEEVREIAKKLFGRYKENSEKAPFYFRIEGPKYYYNYKLWKILNEFARGLLSLDTREDKIVPSNKLKEIINTLNSIKEEIEEYKSKIAEASSSISRMLNELKKIDYISNIIGTIDPMLLVRIPLITREVIITSTNELIELVWNWKNSVEELSGKIDRVMENARELSSIVERFSKYKLIDDKLNSLRKKLIEYNLKHIVNELDKYMDLLVKSIQNIESTILTIISEASINSIEDLVSLINRLIKVFKEIRLNEFNQIEYVKSSVNKFINEVIKSNDENTRNYIGIIRYIIESIQYAEETGVIHLDLDARRRLKDVSKDVDDIEKESCKRSSIDILIHDVQGISSTVINSYRLLNSAKRVLEDTIDVIIEAGLISENEVEIYRKYWEIKIKVAKNEPFIKVCSMIAKELNMDVNNVRRILAKYIERGLIHALV